MALKFCCRWDTRHLLFACAVIWQGSVTVCGLKRSNCLW